MEDYIKKLSEYFGISVNEVNDLIVDATAFDYSGGSLERFTEMFSEGDTFSTMDLYLSCKIAYESLERSFEDLKPLSLGLLREELFYEDKSADDVGLSYTQQGGDVQLVTA